MASTTNHFSLSLSTKQTASSTTPKLNTNSSHLHCFQSSKFLSPRYSLELNLKCVSMLSAGQGRSIRACADLGQVTDQFTTKAEHEVPTIVEVDVGNLGCPMYEFGFYNRSYPIYIGPGLLDKPELLQRDPSTLAYAIKRSCENKAEVVSWDETESGLNLGHTFGYVGAFF